MQPGRNNPHAQGASSAPTIVSASGYPVAVQNVVSTPISVGSPPVLNYPSTQVTNGASYSFSTVPYNPNVMLPPIQSQPSSQPPTNPPPFDPNLQRSWSSGPCDCAKDEETCWWGTWCCCILFSRNAQTFDVGSSLFTVYAFSAWVALCVITFIFIGPVFFWIFVLGSIAYNVQRARVRTAIREKLNIFGNFYCDCIYHLFLKQCSVCQEAREAKALRLKEIDYISGQDMSELAARDEEVPPSTLKELYGSLSIASKLIVKVSAVFVAFVTGFLLMRRPSFVLILFLVFLQPAVILYFVYWRQRRQYVQVDYVVKLFVVGFFMSTTQSIVFEEILQTVITMAMFVLFLIFNGAPSGGTDTGGDNSGGSNFFLSGFSNKMTQDNAGIFWESMQSLRQCHQRPLLQTLLLSGQDMYDLFLSSTSSVSPSSIGVPSVQAYPGLSHYFTASSSDFSSDGFSTTSNFFMQQSIHVLAKNGTATNDDLVSSLDEGLLRRNILLLVLYLFLLAFVVAAGVEETMKHFVVRCCRFPQPLKEPQTLLVYLLTAALGFATAENIEYVLGAKSSPIAGVSLFVGEIFILVIRILMPIHLICAVLQAAQMSKRETGIDPNMPLFKVLLPGIILHGTFDFFLFLVSALQYIYKIENIGFDIFTMIFPFVMTIGGIIWAVRVFGEVESRYRSEWRPLQAHAPETSQPMSDDDTVEIQMNSLHQSLTQGYSPPLSSEV
jgi:Cys-rich protein (TIGR01571 family)